jgi:hypothetical protein
MIKNANDFEQMIKEQFHSPGLLPAYPHELKHGNGTAQFHGVTKREYFAGLAMQALITDVNYSLDAVANLSVEMSDKILKELDKK